MERTSERRKLGRGLLQLMLAAAVVLGAARSGWAQDVKVLQDFEDAAELARLDDPQAGELVAEHASHGGKALKVAPGKGLTSSRWDFSDAANYEWLAVDIFNPTEEVRSVLVTIKDIISQNTVGPPAYWARYNETIALRPGMNTVKLPINNLFRGERGSQVMKEKGPIVAQDIKQASFVPDYPQKRDVFFIDYVRLEKEERAAEVPGMKRFDFGPPKQTVFPGFTAVTFDTTYTKERGFGLAHAQSAGWARDDQYPNSLYGDYCELKDDTFSIDLPNGDYAVRLVYDDPGYWGGEFKPFHERSIEAEGKTFCVERLSDEEALARYNHFQDYEPLPGTDVYETYIGYRFKPCVFTVPVTDGQLNITAKADGVFVSKVAALIVYPTKEEAAAKLWLADLEKRLRSEYDALWVYVPARNPNAGEPLPYDVLAGDWVVFSPPLETAVGFSYTPAAGELVKEITLSAARGEYEPILLGVRPLKDLGAATVKVADFTGPAGSIPASAVEVRVVRNLTRRAAEGRYTIAPAVLLPFKEVELKKDLTRKFWLTLHVPQDAKPGAYAGSVTLSAGGKSATVPVKLTVHPFTLEEADFTFGFFWVSPNLGEVYGPNSERYWQVEEELLKMLKDHGLTSFTGSPLPNITGVKDGEAVLDFSQFDRFWKLALKVGFHRDYQAYGRGVGGLSQTTAQAGGITYEQLMRSTFRQLAEHSKAMGVPPMTMSLCDEPRTEDQYQQLYAEFAVWQKAAPEFSAGYLSLTKKELEEAGNPHKKLFDLLTVPIVNSHDAAVLEYARKQGKRVDIYNQGTSRFSFGLYQYREKREGVGARWQWIMNIAHGDPYYDLDGREPDPCAVYFRTDGLAPALMLEVAREGIDDLRYITTAVAMAKKAEASGSAEAKAAAKQALARIDEAMAKLQVGTRGNRDIDLDALRQGLAEDMTAMSK